MQLEQVFNSTTGQVFRKFVCCVQRLRRLGTRQGLAGRAAAELEEF
jgi:hypothetical protein